MLKNVAGQKVFFSLFKSGARIANPTIAAGDFKVDIDGAGQANVSSLPTSDAAGLVTWEPTQAETNGDYVTLLGVDAAGDEWEPLTIVFETQMPTSVEAILVDTAEIGAAGAGLTAVGLADDAITAAKFDESTAFPLKAADAGSTYVARTGADGDTLETLSDQLDDIPADVWDVALPGGYPVGDAGYILGHLDGLDITAVSPVLDDETIELYEGDSYYEADGRSLKWTDSGSTWPNITGATVALLIRAPNGDQLSAAGVVSIGGGGAGQQVYVELSAAQTAAMVDWPKPSEFRLRVALVSGHVVTLAAGTMTVVYDIA